MGRLASRETVIHEKRNCWILGTLNTLKENWYFVFSYGLMRHGLFDYWEGFYSSSFSDFIFANFYVSIRNAFHKLSIFTFICSSTSSSSLQTLKWYRSSFSLPSPPQSDPYLLFSFPTSTFIPHGKLNPFVSNSTAPLLLWFPPQDSLFHDRDAFCLRTCTWHKA